jgi:hypothetical protein
MVKKGIDKKDDRYKYAMDKAMALVGKQLSRCFSAFPADGAWGRFPPRHSFHVAHRILRAFMWWW